MGIRNSRLHPSSADAPRRQIGWSVNTTETASTEAATALQSATHQHQTSHPWLQVLAGWGRTQHVLHHLHTQAAGFRGTWRQDVGRLAARKAAGPTRGYHCDWLGHRVVCKDKTYSKKHEM